MLSRCAGRSLTPKPDYGHPLRLGTFLSPPNCSAQRPVELAQLSERLGYDFVAFQDYPHNSTWLNTWTLPGSKRLPQGRPGRPQEIAAACLFLAGPEATYTLTPASSSMAAGIHRLPRPTPVRMERTPRPHAKGARTSVHA